MLLVRAVKDRSVINKRPNMHLNLSRDKSQTEIGQASAMTGGATVSK